MNEPFDYSRYLRPVGPRGGDTSRAGANRIEGEAITFRNSIKGVIALRGLHGATGDEAAALAGLNKYAARPRLSELRAAGEIVDSGKRRKSDSGVISIVWVLPQFKEVENG